MELREKIWEAVIAGWSSYDITDDKDAVTDAILAIPEIRDALSKAKLFEDAKMDQLDD